MAALPLRMRRNVLLIFLAIIMFPFLGIWTAHSAQVSLAWDPNNEPDIAGYRVHYGTASRSYQVHLDSGLNTTYTVANLPDGGTYFFAVTAYNSSAIESAYSGEVSYTASLPCSYTISPTSQSVPSAGGTGIVSVTAPSGCTWTAVSNASWLLITSNSTGAANGTVNYSVLANSTANSRSGTLTVAGKSFTVNQQGASPTASFTITATAGTNGSISPSGAVSVPQGGARTFAITPSSGYAVSGVKVDGVSIGAVSSYSFANVTANHTLTASFVLLRSSPNQVLALNSGGGAYTDTRGVRFEADRHFVGGASGRSRATIRGTADGALYRDERYGNFSYVIPLAAGSYDLTLKFVESTHSARNQRVFSLWVEGRLSLKDLDIYAVGGKNTAFDITFTVTVSDGVLNLDFLPSAGDAQVSAILVSKASGSPKRTPWKLKRYFTTELKTNQ